MPKFSKSYGTTSNSGEQERAPFLLPSQVNALPIWNPVSIVYGAEKEAAFGNYPWFIFRSADDKWVTSHRFFNDRQLKNMLKLWDIHSGIDDPNVLVGKKLYISVGIRKGRDGKDYVTVTGFSLDGKVKTVADNGDKSKPIKDEDVPF